MTENKIVIENPKTTVVASYQGEARTETQYQSEAALEKAFIQRLQGQAYEYLPLHTEQDLISNLRRQMEKLNDISFTDAEWKRFYNTILANQNNGIVEKTRLIQEDNVQTFLFDNGEQRNIRIFDKKNVHNNSLQVINQYTPEGGYRENRYDVTILVNGLPLVHVELKRRGVPIREAFNQINRYQRESFWSGTGLFEYVQIFVISNGTETKYYSNTTRFAHVKQNSGHQKPGQGKHTSNSFEFTSWWADERNVPITDLMDFTATFFAKHTLLNILAKYCIFTSEQLLMVMRPYQICATEKIINRIIIAHNYHWEGSIKAGGYIWHTTGSGKTLTSFKTARLATQMDFVDKVVFVVDRKDLDYQTMKEYDRFEKGAANSNTSSNILRRQLGSSDPQKKLVITTIQKLASMLKNKTYEDEVKAITQKQIVFIFDECHRSQFGDMHTLITKKFKHYYIFGFTGTPIFAKNASTSGNPNLKTTAQAFGDKLHSYTIVDAIRDRNVLPFRVEYISTMKEKKDIENQEVWSIDTDNALKDPRRIKLVTEYIIKHFNQKTKRNDKSFIFNKLLNVNEVASSKKQGKVEEVKQLVRMTGFNSIFAVASIEYAKLYYNEFKRQHSGLKVATIFSYGVNDEDDGTGMEDENNEDTNGMQPVDRDFLEAAIQDYNAMFGTNYDTSADKFQNYYKDVSLRMKNREIDILIVVNMFLTGFDATTLNTLWVDKNLRMHGLLQAYSRTNRILNSIKTFGNIVCFRNLEKATNDAIALFGNKDACGLVLMKTYEEYYKGYEDDKGHHVKGYEELVELLRAFKPGEIIASEEEKKAFVKFFGALLRVLNILQAFDQFAGNELISERDMQDYLGMYNDIYQAVKNGDHNKEEIKDDLVFEMELVKQVEINIDYILALVKKYKDQNSKDRELTLQDIDRAIKSSPQMRNKKELIDAFVKSITPSSDVDDDWNTFVRTKMQEEISDIIKTEHLKDAPARKFIHDSFDNGYVQTEGTGIADIMPPLNPFKKNAGREEKKAVILDKIKALFNRFYDLVGPSASHDADSSSAQLYNLPEESELSMAAEPSPTSV
jgi:type I restriction enzyme R subunit